MFKYLLYFLLLNISYMQYVEFDLGGNYALAELEDYSDDGFTIRATYSNNISDSNFFRWQAAFQYISFYRNTYYDSFAMVSGLDGPEIEVTNSQNGYLLTGGLRFTPDLGLFNDRGIFKPYSSFSIGLGYFNETTKYEDPDWFDEEDEFSLSDIEKQQFNFIYALEFGSNFNFIKWNGYGLDLGVRYNMIPGIKSTNGTLEGNCDDQDDDGECDTGTFIGKAEALGNKIDADYITYYIGVSIPLSVINHSKNDKKLANL